MPGRVGRLRGRAEPRLLGVEDIGVAVPAGHDIARGLQQLRATTAVPLGARVDRAWAVGLLLFAGLTAVAVAQTWVAITQGNIARFWHGADSYGATCGVGDRSSRPRLLRPGSTSGLALCVAQCPSRDVLPSAAQLESSGYCLSMAEAASTSDALKNLSAISADTHCVDLALVPSSRGVVLSRCVRRDSNAASSFFISAAICRSWVTAAAAGGIAVSVWIIVLWLLSRGTSPLVLALVAAAATGAAALFFAAAALGYAGANDDDTGESDDNKDDFRDAQQAARTWAFRVAAGCSLFLFIWIVAVLIGAGGRVRGSGPIVTVAAMMLLQSQTVLFVAVILGILLTMAALVVSMVAAHLAILGGCKYVPRDDDTGRLRTWSYECDHLMLRGSPWPFVVLLAWTLWTSRSSCRIFGGRIAALLALKTRERVPKPVLCAGKHVLASAGTNVRLGAVDLLYGPLQLLMWLVAGPCVRCSKALEVTGRGSAVEVALFGQTLRRSDGPNAISLLANPRSSASVAAFGGDIIVASAFVLTITATTTVAAVTYGEAEDSDANNGYKVAVALLVAAAISWMSLMLPLAMFQGCCDALGVLSTFHDVTSPLRRARGEVVQMHGAGAVMPIHVAQVPEEFEMNELVLNRVVTAHQDGRYFNPAHRPGAVQDEEQGEYYANVNAAEVPADRIHHSYEDNSEDLEPQERPVREAWAESNEDDHRDSLYGVCKVCFDNSATQLCTPCSHLCLCETCAETLQRNTGQGERPSCPICRAHVQSFTRVFM